MKISVITAVFNREKTILDSLQSLRAQSYSDVEHVIIDGVSTDNTLAIIRENISEGTLLISEPDNGIYDAINKGLKYSTGDIVGVLHSDDKFFDSEVLHDVAKAFNDPEVDAVYGDLQYISEENPALIIRYWRTGLFSKKKLLRGWMPPHPTLFIRRSLIMQLGGYDTQYRISADYDFIIRYFCSDINSIYIPRVLVKMRLGGESNGSLIRVLLKMKEDYQILRRNGIGGIATLTKKNLSKIGQFFS